MGYPIIDSQHQLIHLLKYGQIDYIFISHDLTMSGELHGFYSILYNNSVNLIRLKTSIKSLIDGYLNKENISYKMTSTLVKNGY
jgi:hypothetical protein